MKSRKRDTVRAGFGKVDITPRVGVELCGFGAYLNRHSTSVYEPIYARALAVQKGNERWVLASCDLIGFDRRIVEKVRALVRKATGWKEKQVMLHAIHTHSGPCTIPDLIGWGDPDDLYLDALPRFVAKACIEAIRNMAPATFSHAVVEASGFSYNRELPDPGRTLNGVLAGKWITDRPEETDTVAQVIRVNRGQRCAGFLTYFSCHPVVCSAASTEISGDFVGVATNRVERDFPGAVGMFLQGTHGDINSNFVHGPHDQALVALDRFAARFAKVIRKGLRRAAPFEVDRVSSALTQTPYTMARFSRKNLLDLLAEQEKIVASADRIAANPNARLAMVFVKSMRRTLERMRRGEKLARPFWIQSLRLGPITLTGLPGETFHRYKRRFQAARGERALLLSTTNDFIGYLPIREIFERGRSYTNFQVPFMLGSVPFTERLEEEVLAGALRNVRRV
jgi:hypothetical protein